MAVVTQVQTQESVARAFWQEKMAMHPNIAGVLAIAGEVAGFFFNGHFLVRLGQWVIRVCGYVAETALMFAVIWITLASVAPGLLELFISKQLIQFILWIALASLAVIPEVILPNTLVNCVKHWFTAARERSPIFWIVAVLFTLPTILFIILTSVTIQTLNANGGNLIQASNNLLNLRCFAGWGYALLEIVYLGVKGSLPQPLRVAPAQPVQQPTTPAQQIDYQEIARQLLPTLRDELKQVNGNVVQELKSEMERLSEQIVNLQAVQITAKSQLVDEPEQENIVNLQSYREVHGDETADDPETRSTPRITVDLQAAKRETKREPAKGSGTAQEKAARILKRTPEITASELAKRAGCTPQYAGRLLKRQSVN